MSVMKDIEENQAKIKAQLLKIEQLEKKLIKQELPSEERAAFEDEINQLKDSLFQTELNLKKLHKKNRKSFLLAVLIFLLLVLAYWYFAYL